MLGLRARLPTQATIAALRALATRGASAAGYARGDDDIVYVTSALTCYRWSTASAAADDGDAVVKPADAGTAGRWLKTGATSSTGYLKAVEFYDGSFDEAQVDLRLLGQRPCVVIHWNGSENIVSSVVPGALYRYRPNFSLWCLSSNLRPGFEGQIGPELSAEAAADPGAQAIVGDLKALLAGVGLTDSLGLTTTPGIDYCEIGRERAITTSLQERRFVTELLLTVYATTHNPETDRVQFAAIDMFDVQHQLSDTGKLQFTRGPKGQLIPVAAHIDPANYRTAGITVPDGASFTQTIEAGSALIADVAVTYAGESKTFTASKDTYRDLLPDGTLTFVEVPNGADEPSVTATALRIGYTVTDAATGVTGDAITCASILDFGDVDQVPPT